MLAKINKKTNTKQVIRKNLRNGDLQTIAEATGLSYGYVRQVITEKRNNTTVWKVADQLLNERENTAEKLKTIAILDQEEELTPEVLINQFTDDQIDQ